MPRGQNAQLSRPEEGNREEKSFTCRKKQEDRGKRIGQGH